MNKTALAMSLALLAPLMAAAEVQQSAADSATIVHRFQVSASPDAASSR